MSQENKLQFSHIAIGRPQDGEPSKTEQEEVIVIGASSADAAPSSEAGVKGANASYLDDTVKPVDAPGDARERLNLETQGAETERELKESDFIVPMSRTQKLVIGACFIGLIITIVFLVWYWVFQP